MNNFIHRYSKQILYILLMYKIFFTTNKLLGIHLLLFILRIRHRNDLIATHALREHDWNQLLVRFIYTLGF